jgi:cell division protein FtsB
MMRNLLGIAAAGSALVVAAPASAQYYPAQYGNRYGYNNFGQVRALQARVDAVQRQIRFLDRRNVIRDDRADRLRFESREIERRLHYAARNGLNPREANEISFQISRLEQRVQYAANGRGYRRY